MEFKRILQCLLLTLIPIYLVTGCGDLEPEMQDTMQDTRTVILNMDYHKKSSSRSSSSFSEVVLSPYNTHLILALPSGDDLTIPEQLLSNNYKDFHTSAEGDDLLDQTTAFAQGLMITTDRTVYLEIPQDYLNKQMKIFAFLFQENYSLPELYPPSATRTVGYYGKSQSFEIGTQTNNLSLGITLCQGQVSGTGTDTTEPTVSSVYPADNQNEVSITENISVTFSEAMNTTLVTTNISDSTCSGSFQLSYNNFSNCVQMSSSPLSSNSYKTFTVDPSINLSHSTNYKIKVTTGVKDTAGNSLCSPAVTSGFTTASP